MSEKKEKKTKAKDDSKADKKEKTATKGTKEKKESKEPAAAKEPSSEEKTGAISSGMIDLISKNPIPGDLYTNRHLTHYDETAGIPIPQSEVEAHIRRGNTVQLLTHAYDARFKNLRTLLTTRLYPKREHLLQLYRKLQQNLDEVDEKAKMIEKETLLDTQQILQRLKSHVSLRESSIQSEVLRVEEHLQGIERLAKRVERANLEAAQQSYSGITLTSAVPSSVPPIQAIHLPQVMTMVEIIQEYPDLVASVNQLATKNIHVQDHFPVDDFPKETAERLEIISRCDRYTHALAVKDQLLWTAIQEKDKMSEALSEERNLTQGYAEEAKRWIEIAHHSKNECQRLAMENQRLERQMMELQQVLRSHNIYYQTE
jgi:hypothetical protein